MKRTVRLIKDFYYQVGTKTYVIVAGNYITCDNNGVFLLGGVFAINIYDFANYADCFEEVEMLQEQFIENVKNYNEFLSNHPDIQNLMDSLNSTQKLMFENILKMLSKKHPENQKLKERIKDLETQLYVTSLNTPTVQVTQENKKDMHIFSSLNSDITYPNKKFVTTIF